MYVSTIKCTCLLFTYHNTYINKTTDTPERFLRLISHVCMSEQSQLGEKKQS